MKLGLALRRRIFETRRSAALRPPCRYRRGTRIWRIAGLSRDMLGTYLCAGVFTMVLWQMFQNIAMSIGLMPITGLPLPFISYGGSSIVTFFALMGLVQSVHMRRYR